MRHVPLKWREQYSGYCLRCDNLHGISDKKPFIDKDGVHYCLCKSCLKETQLGPWRIKPRTLEYEDW